MIYDITYLIVVCSNNGWWVLEATLGVINISYQTFCCVASLSNNKQKFSPILLGLIRDLLSNTPKLLCACGLISWIFIYGECVTEVCEAERNWREKSS